MRFCAVTALFSAMLWGQQPPAQTPAPTPPIPNPVFAPHAKTATPPDTVVAEIEGKKLTAADLDKLLSAYPPPIQQAMRANPARSLSQLLLFRHLAEMAEKEGLDKQSPYRESLEYQRLALLAQAEMNAARYKTSVTNKDAEKIYNEHPERFAKVKVRAIYVAFNPLAERGAGDKKLPAEAEAKAKIDDLRRQVLAGGDFGKLAKENSDDKVSAAKDGEFGIIQRSSPYPDALKNAVLALKQGEISEPIRQPSGFYLIRVDEIKTPPFNDVANQLLEEVRQARFNEWMKSLESQFSVKIEDSNYFAPRSPVQLPQAH